MSNGVGGDAGGGTVGQKTRSHESLRLYLQSQFELLPNGLKKSITYRAGLRRIARGTKR